MFSPLRKRAALFMPPSQLNFLLRFALQIERWGGRWWRNFGGVRLVEASKQIYRLNTIKSARRVRRRVVLPVPATSHTRWSPKI
jgi:hypothetical protein